MVQAKAPLPPPMADDRVFPTVSFRHPAYPDYESEFMLLSAVDGDDLGDGLDYDTAFLACCIAAGNKWHAGWLAEKHRDSFSPVDVPEDRILRGDKYYLMMNGFSPNFKYPIVPSFDHWRFPHGGLPAPWSELVMSPSGLGSSPFWSRHNNRRAAPVRDLGCRVTGYSHGCESTHVVPITESDWFFANEMKRYVRNPTTLSSIDDERNMALLRHDIQWLFNTQCMTMAVKMATPEGIFNVPETPQLVSHVLQPDAMELIDLYQNRLMRGMTGVSVELMFTRFAWSVLNNEVMTFFRGRLDYTVLLFDTQKGKQVTRQMSGSKIRGLPPLFRSPSRARGNSASLHNHPSAPHLRHGLDRGRDPSRGRTRDRGQDQSRVSEEGRGAAVDQPVIYGLSAGVAQNYDRPEMSGAMPEWDTRSVQSYSTVVDENVRDEWMREEDEEERLQENVEVEEARGRGKKRNCSPPPCARSRSRSSSAISPSPAIPLLVPSPQNENEEEQPSVASSPMPSQHDEDEREDLSVAAPSPCTICGDKPCKGRPKRLRMEGRL